MNSKKILKPNQKPSPTKANTRKAENKVVVDSKNIPSLSPGKSNIHSQKGSQILKENIEKNKRQAERKLKDIPKNQNLKKNEKKNHAIEESNSSKQSSHSLTKLQKQQRIKFYKQREIMKQSKTRQNSQHGKGSLNNGRRDFISSSKEPKNTKSSINLISPKEQKSINVDRNLQNKKKATVNLNIKPRIHSQTASVNSSTGTRKSKRIVGQSPEKSNVSDSLSIKSKKDQNLIKAKESKLQNISKGSKTIVIVNDKKAILDDSISQNSKKSSRKQKTVIEKPSSNVNSKPKQIVIDPIKSQKYNKIPSEQHHQTNNHLLSHNQHMPIGSNAKKSSKKQTKRRTILIERQFSNEFQVPSYSQEQMRQIQAQLSSLNSKLRQNVEHNQSLGSIICLVSWIWQAESFNYKRKKESEKNIEVQLCIRKLLELYDKTDPSIFYKPVALEKIKFQTDLCFDPQKTPIQQNRKIQIEQSDIEQEINTTINFRIYELCRKWQSGMIEQVKILPICLLIEIIVFKYGEIVILDYGITEKVIKHFRAMNFDKKIIPSLCLQEQKIIQELIVYTFSEFNVLRMTHSRSPFFVNKKKNEEILWIFVEQLFLIFDRRMRQKEFINFRLNEANTLQTAYYLTGEFTHFMKRYSSKMGPINIINAEKFLLTIVERIVQFNVYILQLKERQKKAKEIDIDHQTKLYEFRIQLLLYDWAMLSIKCEERKTFYNVLKHCKSLFEKNLEKKSTSKYETYKNKSYVTDKYARYTIQQLPDEDKSFYEERYNEEKLQQDSKSGYKITHEKIKAFVSIPHMNFLVFKEFVPWSVKRLPRQKKQKHQWEVFDHHLLYLLILGNREYLLKLIQEIEFIEVELLNPQISRGLVRLCGRCQDFKSLRLGEKYLKLLDSVSIHKQILQKVFQKDTDYQRRLSSSINQNNITAKFLIQQDVEQKGNNIQRKEPLQKEMLKNFFEVRLKSCESMYFEIIMEIQNVICLIKLEHYIKEIIQNPEVFRVDKFYMKLLQSQHLSSGRYYLSELITRYVDQELKIVDILAYFEIFAYYCLKMQDFQQMAILIKELSIAKLIKFHCLLLEQTFNDQISYRGQIPQSLSKQEKFNILTSGGHEEKTRFIDRHFSEISQIILWRKYLKSVISFERMDRCIYIKAYFTIVHEIYSSEDRSPRIKQNINFAIEKLRTFVQKDKIDQVCSIFHFLSLSLFNRPKQNVSSSSLCKNLKKEKVQFFGSLSHFNSMGIDQKLTEEIFYLINDQKKTLVEMYRNKESATMRCLGDQIRKRQNNEVNDQIEDFKRRQVSKMLNKMKNMHDYLIKSIIRFIQNACYTSSMLRSFRNPEEFMVKVQEICRCEHMQKTQRSYQLVKEYHTHKMNFYFSSVSSNHVFQQNFKRQLKRYRQNPKQVYDRYGFLIMVRCIAERWIEEKLPQKTADEGQKTSKVTKSSKFPENISSKIKEKDSKPPTSNLLSVDQIFEICIESINNPLGENVGVRESQILKQKLMALQTIGMLFSQITSKNQTLKIILPSVIKNYKAKHHPEVSKVVINLLMNKAIMLGRQQKDLITAIRLKALQILIQSFRDRKYINCEWKILQSGLQFWFVICTLTFDKAIEIRFSLIRYFYSRNSKNLQLRQSLLQILTVSLLMSVQQPMKPLVQIVKKSLIQMLNSQMNIGANSGNQNYIVNIINSVSLQFFLFLVNFNTMHILQKDQQKLNYREFFMVLIDMLFDQKEFECYFYPLVVYFKNINQKKEDMCLNLKQVRWLYEFNVEFFMMSKVYDYKSSIFAKEKNSPEKAYLELVKDMKEDEINNKSEKISNKNPSQFEKMNEIYVKKYPHSQEVFKYCFNDALKVLEEVFLERAAKSNKKVMKIKKPVSIFKNMGQIFDKEVLRKIGFVLKPDNKTGTRTKESDQQIQI